MDPFGAELGAGNVGNGLIVNNLNYRKPETKFNEWV
jgi:hypothetical protein